MPGLLLLGLLVRRWLMHRCLVRRDRILTVR